MGKSLSQIITAIGDDNICCEPVDANITNAQSIKTRGPNRERLTRITLLTSQFTPDDALALTMPEGDRPQGKMGIVIWFTREDYARATAPEKSFSEDGTEYCPAGWYETNECEEVYFRVTDPVTHWMPLPDPPSAERPPTTPEPASPALCVADNL